MPRGVSKAKASAGARRKKAPAKKGKATKSSGDDSSSGSTRAKGVVFDELVEAVRGALDMKPKEKLHTKAMFGGLCCWIDGPPKQGIMLCGVTSKSEVLKCTIISRLFGGRVSQLQQAFWFLPADLHEVPHWDCCERAV